MSRIWWTVARTLGGVAILAAVLWRLGTGPFLDAIGSINGWSLAAAVAIAGLTTVCCAWRWRLVAGGLGLHLSMPGAVAAYYRSQFLNMTLPGGVLGDVHRGVRQGRDSGQLGRGLRAVAWERISGQLVQAVLTLLVLLLVASPVRLSVLVAVAAAVACVLGVLVLIRVLPGGGAASWWARTRRAMATDVRDGLLARRIWPGVVLASTVVVAGHTATFLIAARTAGTDASTIRLLPLASVVLLAAAVPTNIGGWGPREGVAAACFGAAGLGADQGVATAVVYGVMALVAGLPGAVVLIVGSLRRRAREMERPEMLRIPPTATIRTQVVLPLRFADGYATTARVFTFNGLVDGREHLAFGLGDRAGALAPAHADAAPLVRPHSECLTGDVFGSQRCDCGPQVREAVERIADAGGFLLYLRQEGRGIGLYAKLDAYALQDAGLDTYEANRALGYEDDERDYTVAAQMMHALGLRQVALLSNNPDKAAQLARLGVTVTERVPTRMHLSAANCGYLAAKATHGGHTLDFPLGGADARLDAASE
jgi:GTP cyclohydrolase II